ncbi:hypothetical protein AWB69_01562 [Caballeronia udeis]|uniref:Uncharacterized protein n=1 Tax=Caballeronia udeis TaxID=1232866 RepID=A0A158FSX7_9BURK|nr:hypothetical protein AWB69_01562 [Caballeronia udeis]
MRNDGAKPFKAKAPAYQRSFVYPNETKLPFRPLECSGPTPTRAAFQAVASPPQAKRRASPAYFFSGVLAGGVVAVVAVVAGVAPVTGVGNGNVLNIDFAWVCICSCICTNMFFDCSI